MTRVLICAKKMASVPIAEAKKMASVPILEAKKMTAKKTVLRVRVQLRKDGECSKTAKKRPKNQSLDENGVFLTLNEKCSQNSRRYSSISGYELVF